MSPNAQRATVEVLPRGRHKLSREHVAESQQSRLVEAMLELVGERGFAATTVAQVVARARVSRSAFYKYFADKEECFLAACDVERDDFLASLYAQAEQADAERALSEGMRVFLERWRDRPEVATAYLIEIPSAGRRAMEQRDRAYDQFEQLLVALAAWARESDPSLVPLPPLHARIVVTALTEIVAREAREGRLERLLDLHDELFRFARAMLIEPPTDRTSRTPPKSA